MIKVNEIKGRIVAEGLTIDEVAKSLGLTRKTFDRRLKKGVMGTDEAGKLIKLLNIQDPVDIFFAD